jgi:hypothetical protein
VPKTLERDRDGGVAEASLDQLRMRALRDEEGGARVAKIVEAKTRLRRPTPEERGEPLPS